MLAADDWPVYPRIMRMSGQRAISVRETRGLVRGEPWPLKFPGATHESRQTTRRTVSRRAAAMSRPRSKLSA
jgi:hypothetical protein